MGSGASVINQEDIQNTKVLIVGAGYGGIAAGLGLRKEGIPFVIVSPREFFYHNLGALRAAVYPEFTDVTTIPLQTTFGHNFRQGSVVDIDFKSKTASLDDGSEEEFTHLVLATGTKGDYPACTDLKSNGELKAYNENVAADIDQAESVVIIGGGAVGCELAGEILDRHPNKAITVINSGDRLLSNVNLGESLQCKTLKALEAKGVKVQLGERVSNMDSLEFSRYSKQVVRTNGGSYKAGIVFKAIGLRPNTDLARAVLGDDKLDPSNLIKVIPELLVEGFDDVYAIGDICNTAQEKMGAHARDHGELVAMNIKLELQGKRKKPYKPKFVGMVIPIGKSGGVGVANGINLPNFAVRKLKSEDLVANKFWEYMGQKIPEVKLE